MRLSDLIARIKGDITARTARYNELTEAINIERGAEAPDEARESTLMEQRAGVSTELEQLRAKLDMYEAELRESQRVAELDARTEPTGAPTLTEERSGIEVNQRRTYTRDNDPKGEQFLLDVAADFLRSPLASQRIGQHMAEEFAERQAAGQQLRGVTTGGAPGLVVPQYLVDMYAPKGRPGRKLADAMTHRDLPETGMTAYIPRQIAQGTVGNQANQLDTASETDYTDEMISVPIRTALGSGTMSRQSVERSLGTEDVTIADLFKAYDKNLDSTLINDATKGLLAVANAITFTSASPTIKDLYAKIVGAAATAEDTLQDLDEDSIFTLMRGRRWQWMKTQWTADHLAIGTNGFDAMVAGTSTGEGYKAAVRGYLPDGGAVITDNNLPKNLGTGTNEDVVAAVVRSEAFLWEDPNAPMYIRAETGPNMKKLAIDLVLYGYYAFCFDRVVDAQGTPKSVHQKITGTGLVAPTF